MSDGDHSVIERIIDDEGVKEEELLRLFVAAFGGVDVLWPANRLVFEF